MPEGPIYSLTFSPLSWRPDGSEVAFDGVGTIVVAEADGSGAHELNLADAESPIYAPDNQTLAFTRIEGRKTAAVWTVNLATGAQRRISPLRHGLEYVAASFSPDSSTLLATIVNRRHGKVEPVALDLESGASAISPPRAANRSTRPTAPRSRSSARLGRTITTICSSSTSPAASCGA